MSLINDALKKAESLQPATPPPAPSQAPVPPAALGMLTPPGKRDPAAPPASPASGMLKLSLNTPPSAPAAPTPGTPPPAPALRLSLSPSPASSQPLAAPGAAATPAQATTGPSLRLTLSPPPGAPTTENAPPALRITAPGTATGATGVSPDSLQAPAAAPLPPPPANGPSDATDGSIAALREQYKRAGVDDQLAQEKAIAAAALGPLELRTRPSVEATPAPIPNPEGAATEAPPPLAKSATPPLPPGATNPLTGLRVPTPELAAAFLASTPTPSSAAPASVPPPLATAKTESPGLRNAPPPRAPGKKTANPEKILLIVGSILAVLLGGGLTAAYLVLRTPAKPSESAAVAPHEEDNTHSPETAVDTTPAESTAGTSAESTSPLPDTGATTTATAPSGSDTNATAPDAGSSPAAATSADKPTEPPAKPEPAPPPPRVNRPDPTILAWVQKIQLTGIRSGTIPKVFMNGKLYEVGEIVEYDLGLRLTGVQGKVLHFVDSEGNTYEYRF